MASKRPIRTLLHSASAQSSPLLSARPAQRYLISTTSANTSLSPTCTFSTSSPRAEDAFDAAQRPPRWRQTPERMVAPYRIRPQPATKTEFKVNEDPRKLDEAYAKMLGTHGDKLLSEEVKWLAVTHKSFDHGRRGFNDRLAYLGRRIVSLQTSLALLNSPQSLASESTAEDQYGRKPFSHPALSGLEGLTHEAEHGVLKRSRLANLARRYGLDTVTRWKPVNPDNLQQSGIDVVLNTSIYAIVGAISLERGGEVANRVVRDKILNPLGFT